MKDERTSLVDMIGGAALFFSRVTRNLEVRTATVNAGVEGTEFFIRADEGKTDLTVFEGKVLASNAEGGLPVTTGQSAVAEAGKAPVYRVVVRPRDAVHWALYYPPVLDARPPDLKEDSNDPRFYTARASQSLTVGRVDEAIADIERAQKLDPRNSDALALQAMIAVTQNEKGKALELAPESGGVGPEIRDGADRPLLRAAGPSSTSRVRWASLEEAVKLDPGNALAWAQAGRVAARRSATWTKSLGFAQRRRRRCDPDLSRTQTRARVRPPDPVSRQWQARGGVRTSDHARRCGSSPAARAWASRRSAKATWRREAGRSRSAVSARPRQFACIRSYLGKAYFEAEARQAGRRAKYDIAKKTWTRRTPRRILYDAIAKQTTNRPVEAFAGRAAGDRAE